MNDTTLLTDLYLTHHTRFTAWLKLRLSVSREEAQDLASEVFLRALRGLPTARSLHTPGDMEAWLWAIARNLSIDIMRWSGPRPLPLLDYDAPDGSNPEAQILRRYEVERVKAVARRVLTTAQAEVLSLAYSAAEPSNEQIAVLVGRGNGAVREMRSRGIRKLRGALSE